MGTHTGPNEASALWLGRALHAPKQRPRPKAVPQHAQTDAVVAELRAQLAEMRSQRDAWQGIAERLALGAPKPPEPEPAASWWRWLRSTGGGGRARQGRAGAG
jgi:hypothetical protein